MISSVTRSVLAVVAMLVILTMMAVSFLATTPPSHIGTIEGLTSAIALATLLCTLLGPLLQVTHPDQQTGGLAPEKLTGYQPLVLA